MSEFQAEQPDSAIKMSAEERLEVQDLFARYAWAYDCGDADAYASLFTPDGVIEAMDGELIRGRAAIGEFVKSFAHKPGFRGTQHHNGQVLFETGDSTRCVVRCYWVSLHWRHASGEKVIKSMGYYISHCEKIGGKWLFAKRVIRYWDEGSVPWKGPAFGVPAAAAFKGA